MEELIEHLHPMIVHFPIALFITALGLDVCSFIFKKKSLHQTAVQIYIFAALCSPLVVQTGLWAAEEHHLKHPVLDKHRFFALWTMWGSIVSLPFLWVVKNFFKRYFRAAFLIFLILMASFVSLTGYNGGRLVYEYAIGVEE